MVNFHLGAYDQSGVQPANTLALANPTAEWDPQTQQFRATYAVGLPGGAAAALLPYPVIYAGIRSQYFTDGSGCPAPLQN